MQRQLVSIIVNAFEELLERLDERHALDWLKRTRRKPLHCHPPEDCLAKRNGK